MNIQTNDRLTHSYPKDKSVEAYKVWIMEIAQRLTTEKNKFQLTEAEWMASWKEYWKEHWKENPHAKL